MRSVINKRACDTCPFRRDAVETAFSPEILDVTVGENLRTGYAHNCHKTNDARHPKVCAGFARFCVENNISNRMLGMAQRFGIFDPETDLDQVTDFELSSWAAVLEMHRERLGG